MHFLWTLPVGDHNYSKRVGRMKTRFTVQVESRVASSKSRWKHRESDVWQRRFHEHTIRDDDDFKQHLDYIHYNAVRHGYSKCPHEWPHSSFQKWVERGEYDLNWGCCCGLRSFVPPDFSMIQDRVGE
jgi:putative transposase